MKISVITVVLNNKHHIQDCIESVLKQSFNDIEYIVIDGQSTDGTVDVIRQYERNISRWVSEPDQGIYDAMNKGIKLATGEIIGFLNGDDFYANDQILLHVSSIFQQVAINSCYGNLVYVNKNNTKKILRFWHAGPYKIQKFFWGWMPPHPTFFVRRDIYERYGIFNPALGSAADYELMLRFLLKHKITTVYIPEVLVKMRSGGISNASIKNRIMAHRKDYLAWEINDLKPYPWTLVMKPLSKLNQYVIR